MKKKPLILSIAASDNTANAGIQADNIAIFENGGKPANIITAITAQNTKGLQAIYPLSVSQIKMQIQSILEEKKPKALKIGVLYDLKIVKIIHEFLEEHTFENVVLDTVLKTSSGGILLKKNAFKMMEKLFEKTKVITPNIPEAAFFLGKKIDFKNMEKAAQILSEKYKTSVFLKGGHLENEKILKDVLYDFQTKKITTLKHPFIKSENTRGTGCKLASAMATFLAFGDVLSVAAEKSVFYLEKILKY